ncbi:MAG: (2Fe-2S)-binding protein [Gammaproteobacteria bacterium]
MYVCICNNVRESDIDTAIAEGARSLACVEQRLGVGSCCGQCVPRATEYLEAVLPNPAVASMAIEARATGSVANLTIAKVTSIKPHKTSSWQQSLPEQLQNNLA